MNNIQPNRTTGVVVSPSQIQYTIITPHQSLVLNDFFKSVYAILKTLPKDLLQLRNSLDFFKLLHNSGLKKGLNLFTLPDQIFRGTPEENLSVFNRYSNIFNKDIVKVFIVDGEIEGHEYIADLINQLPFAYFLIIGERDTRTVAFYDSARSFSTVYELINLIEKALPEIDAVIEREYGFKIGSFNLSVDPMAPKLNPVYPTLYATANYFLLNQVLANYWLEEKDNIFNQEALPPGQRVTTLIKQVKFIDELHHWAWDGKKPVTPIAPYYPSMIIIAPFHFPRYSRLLMQNFKTKKEKMLFRASQTEQLPDYTYGIEEDMTKYLQTEQIAAVLSILTERLIILDDISYLHAQLDNSPIYRLPIVGKSLNMDLSHFQKDFSNKKTAINKIDKLGELMTQQMVPEALKNLLSGRNGQLVFISDLPMEWLKLNKYPLMLTHDICRIPQFNNNSLLNNYIHNQRLTFRIKPDIIKRTLIIHCADEADTDMQRLFRVFERMKDSLGFSSVICKSVEEISTAVKEHRPDLLIFDCHGGFDEKELSSYLVINNRKKLFLTGEDIEKHQIAAPLVFISACSTMPNYGYVKFLSDAFFQAGAFSVTATFLPIKMIDAAALVIRILHNLKYQATRTIFSNWLSFICHTLRSTLIYETVRKKRFQNNLPEEFDEKKLTETLLELMQFHKRELAFENLANYLKELNPAMDTLFENLEHEWLSYTTLGRADLIYFENWLKDHQKESLGETFI